MTEHVKRNLHKTTIPEACNVACGQNHHGEVGVILSFSVFILACLNFMQLVCYVLSLFCGSLFSIYFVSAYPGPKLDGICVLSVCCL